MAIELGLTIEDFEKLPDALALNHELVEGELVQVSGNTLAHNSLRDLIIRLLAPVVERDNIGRVVSEQEFKFGDDAHGPDVSFIGAGKTDLLEQSFRVQRFVPDLAIEIASKNDRFEALLRKALRYREYGTKEVWVFSIGLRQAYFYSEHGRAILDENDQFQSGLIPGFSIRIGDLLDRI